MGTTASLRQVSISYNYAAPELAPARWIVGESGIAIHHALFSMPTLVDAP